MRPALERPQHGGIGAGGSHGAAVHRPGHPAAARADGAERHRLELGAQRRIDEEDGAVRRLGDVQAGGRVCDRARRGRAARRPPRTPRRGAPRSAPSASPPRAPSPTAGHSPRPSRDSAPARSSPARPRWRDARCTARRPPAAHRAPDARAAAPDRRRRRACRRARRSWSRPAAPADRGRVPSSAGCRRSTRSSAASITAWKIGPAPVTPDEPSSGVRSKLPTHTPTVTSRV